MRMFCFFLCLIADILTTCPLVYADITSPKLIEPCDGASVLTTVHFEWEESVADSYTLQILDWLNPKKIIFEDTTTNNKYQVPNNKLSKSTPYYWHVKVCNASEESEWSPDWGFRTLPNAVDPFQMEKDIDDDGIPDIIEKEILTSVDKKTLFVRPIRKIGPKKEDVEYWQGFISLFPGSHKGRANIKPFTDEKIEVVVIGDTTNPYEPMKNFSYDPANDPNEPPCTIMELLLERSFDDTCKPVYHSTFERDKGHTQLLCEWHPVKSVYKWVYSRPAYTDSNQAEKEYNFPKLYPYPLDRYIYEGAYNEIKIDQTPATKNCLDSPEKCNKASPMNLPDNDSAPPFPKSQDETVEFNEITCEKDGKITNIAISKRAKPYSRSEVLAKLVVHEMGHGLLSAVKDEHCENPCCIMYDCMRDWEQLPFGPFCGAGRAEKCSHVCKHSAGGSKDIRHKGVVCNIRQQKKP